MRGFVEARVKPYYLHHGDLAPGTGHFRTTIAEGRALMRALRRAPVGIRPFRPRAGPARRARQNTGRPSYTAEADDGKLANRHAEA